MASAVSCIVAQRLIRTVCMECAKVYTPKKADLEMLGLTATANGHQFVHGTGCENCMKTGYFGRTGIFEFLIPNDQIRELLEANASPSAIRDVARKFGFKSLREEGIVKIFKDQTTAEEVVRMTAN